MTPLELGTLFNITHGAPPYNGPADDVGKVLEQFHSPEDRDEWTYRFPDEFTVRLATATPRDIETWSRNWAETDEMPDREFESLLQEVAEHVEMLHRLAQLATEDDKDLYMWCSL